MEVTIRLTHFDQKGTTKANLSWELPKPPPDGKQSASHCAAFQVSDTLLSRLIHAHMCNGSMEAATEI
jgi:hypothetical protein